MKSPAASLQEESSPARFFLGARLTIDVGAGDRWLIALNRHATQNWLTTSNPVLDYANAMVGGMLGYMFWAAEYPSARRGYTATIPPNTCELGIGAAATTFNIPIPMPQLRQQ